MCASLGVEKKGLQRQVKALEKDNTSLKEEISSMITKCQEARASNLKLSQELEEAMDRCDLLAAEKDDLHATFEDILVRRLSRSSLVDRICRN